MTSRGQGPGALHGPPRTRERVAAAEAALGTSALTAKIAAAALAGSLALWVDTIRTAGVLARDVIGWVILRRVGRGRGRGSYDPAKVEGLSGLIGAALMLVATGLLLVLTWRRLAAGEGAGAPAWAVAAGLVLGAGNLVLWYRARRGESVSHRRSDYGTRAIANLSVAGFMATALLVPAAGPALDVAGALVACVFVLRTVYDAFSDSLSVLLDATLEESYQLVILRHLADHFDEYSQFHGVRSRRSAGRAYIEIFLEFDPDRRLAQVQAVMDGLRAGIEAELEGSRVFVVPVTERIR